MPAISSSAITRLSLGGTPSSRYSPETSSSQSISDLTSLSDQSQALLSSSQSLADSVSVSDESSFVYTANGFVTDGASFADLVDVVATFSAYSSDSVAITDLSDGEAIGSQSCLDYAAFAATVVAYRTVPVGSADSIGINDSLSELFVFPRAVTDSLAMLDDSDVRMVARTESFDQSPITDEVTVRKTIYAVCDDNLLSEDRTRRIIKADLIKANSFFLAVSGAGGYIKSAGANGRISVASSEASIRSS